MQSASKRNARYWRKRLDFGINSPARNSRNNPRPSYTSRESLIRSVSAEKRRCLISDESVTLVFMASRYALLLILLQSTQRRRRVFSIMSSHILALLPLPSINGWAMFISIYLFAISSKRLSGMVSTLCSVSGRKRTAANWKPSLCDVERANLPGEVIQPTEQIAVYLL